MTLHRIRSALDTIRSPSTFAATVASASAECACSCSGHIHIPLFPSLLLAMNTLSGTSARNPIQLLFGLFLFVLIVYIAIRCFATEG